jgi:flagella basal body P-ring formation protein FlgA
MMMRAVVHIGLLIACGAVAMLTVTPARGAEPLSPQVFTALEQALTFPGARIDAATEERPMGRSCTPREITVPRPVDGSGRFAVKVSGTKAGGAACEVWTWVRVRVVADVAVTRRALRPGEAIADAVTTETRELRAGQVPARLIPGAVAARSLPAGQLVQADGVSVPTARPGEQVKVMVVAGALAVEQTARSIPCTRGRSCAVLPSGKQVEGDLIDGRLVVVLP